MTTQTRIDEHRSYSPSAAVNLGGGFSVALCAALCGICTAVTVGTVWHSKERETETQARIRVLQNHVDELQSLVRVSNHLEQTK